jgi:hypothetical protein
VSVHVSVPTNILYQLLIAWFKHDVCYIQILSHQRRTSTTSSRNPLFQLVVGDLRLVFHFVCNCCIYSLLIKHLFMTTSDTPPIANPRF